MLFIRLSPHLKKKKRKKNVSFVGTYFGQYMWKQYLKILPVLVSLIQNGERTRDFYFGRL